MFFFCTLYISQEDSSSSIYFLDSKATMLLKSFSSQFKLILESVNSQYDERLFIQFPEKYKFTTCCGKQMFVFLLTFKTILVHNM